MKRYTLFSMILLPLFFSCSDWLEVNPEDEITEEELFSNGEGYRNALNGVYRTLANKEMYGQQLTWGVLDGMAQYYDKSRMPTTANDIKSATQFDYTDSYTKPVVEEFWTVGYNAVANCSNIIQNIRNDRDDKFEGGHSERSLIEGEAKALRAFIQFDLLRLYAPGPLVAGGDKYLPYINTYPSLAAPKRTVSECMDMIIQELKEAKALIYEFDSTDMTMLKADVRFKGALGSIRFLRSRGYRFNYYAVTAILARAYLYVQDYDNAYKEAKEVIDFQDKKGYYSFTSSYNMSSQGCVKAYLDLLGAFYSTKLLDWDQAVNDVPGASSSDVGFLSLMGLGDRFGDEIDYDYRYKNQIESYSGGYRLLKYRPVKNRGSYAAVNETVIPVIGIAEVYYIAGEAIFKKNPEEAISYLTTVKKGRGIRNVDLSDLKKKSLDDYLDVLQEDAWREFMGAGQMFFFYKRLNRPILTTGNPINPDNKNFVLPIPDSEVNIK